jgi:hypothetical protein
MTKPVNVTFNQQSFDNIGVPVFESWGVVNVMLPNLKLGKTYYKLTRKNIEAFRLIAMAIKSNYAHKELTYLVQTPNNDLKWVNKDYITETSVIFEDYNHYLNYLQGDKTYNVNKSNEWYNSKSLLVNAKSYNEEREHFEHSWYIDSFSQAPKQTATIIKYFLILENSVEICLMQRDGNFNTKEECIAHQLNGFVIDDFEQEVQNITINILPNKAIKKTLHVIEVGA